jgi:formate dehydrogenase major subunit
LPDNAFITRCLEKLEFYAAIDFFLNDTAWHADVVLPGSLHEEDEGTVTQVEGRIIKINKAVDCPGEAREDWRIVVDLARRLGLGWDYAHPREVFAEMKLSMPSLDHITWDRLEAEGAVGYPSLSDDDPGQPVVFGDGFPREGGRARFTPARVTPPAEVPDADYPFVLTTGRQLEHWHTGSMTRRASVLDALEPEATCSLHPATLRRLGTPPGGMVRLTTRRGSVALKARADRAVAEDMVFIPFAYVEAAANILTSPALDPWGKIPEFKFAAVRVEPAAEGVAAE